MRQEFTSFIPANRQVSPCNREGIVNDPELGQFSLILAFATALLLGSYPLTGPILGRLGMMSAACPLAYSQFLLLLLPFICLHLGLLSTTTSPCSTWPPT